MKINTPTAVAIVAVTTVAGAIVAMLTNNASLVASILVLGGTLAHALGGRNNKGGGANPQ